MKLHELFTDPYKLEWDTTHTPVEIVATFRSNLGNVVQVSFERESLELYAVGFTLAYKDPKTGQYERTYLKTGQGDAPRIFATVIAAIQVFVNQYEPKFLWFSASATEPSRIKLYNTMVNSLARTKFTTVTDPDDEKGIPEFIKSEFKRTKLAQHFLLKNRKYTEVDEVVIDNKGGAGAVPDNLNVDYLGLKVSMKPSMFLKLAAKLGEPQSAGELQDYIKQGGAIGAPFLNIQLPEEWFDSPPDFEKTARIAGHEGRNRMIAVQQAEGDEPVEVHLFFRGGIRSRHLTPEIVERLQYNTYGIYNQDRKFMLDSPLFYTGLNESVVLNELFAKPYTYTGQGKVYTFTTKTGNTYTVDFDEESVFDKESKKWILGISITFGLTNKEHDYGMKVEKTGDAFNVFATVFEITRNFLSNNPKYEYAMFLADKDIPSRLKLYNSFMKMLPQVLPEFTLYKTIDDFDNVFRYYVLKRRKGQQ